MMSQPQSITVESTPVDSTTVDISVVEELVSTPATSLPEQNVWRVRWGYLLPRLAVVSLFYALLVFGLEPLLHLAVTRGLSWALRTPVALERFHIHWGTPGLEWQQLQIADAQKPQQNALQVKQISIQMDRPALLRKKWIINEAVVAGVEWNTASTILLPEPATPPTETGFDWSFLFGDQIQKWETQFPVVGQEWIQQQLTKALTAYDPQNLETVQVADQKEAEWKQRFVQYRIQFEQTRQRIERLKQQLETVKTGNPLAQFEQYAQLAREMESLIAEGEQLKREFETLIPLAHHDLQDLNEAKSRDLTRLHQSLAALPTNSEELTRALLGPEAQRQWQQLAEGLQFVQNLLNLSASDFEPARTAGRTIALDRADDLPTFLIRRLKISGQARTGTESAPFAGLITNLTPDPQLISAPIHYQFHLRHHGDFKVQGLWDRSRPVPHCKLICRFETHMLPNAPWQLAEGWELSCQAQPVQGILQLELKDNQLESSLKWQQSQLKWIWKQQQQPSLAPEMPIAGTSIPATDSPLDQSALLLTQLLRDSLAPIERWQGEVHLSGPVSHPTLTWQSDLGEQLVQQLQTGFQHTLQQRQEDLQPLAEQQIQERTQQLVRLIEQEYRTTLLEWNEQEALARGLLEKVAIRPASGVLDRLLR